MNVTDTTGYFAELEDSASERERGPGVGLKRKETRRLECVWRSDGTFLLSNFIE